MIDDHFDDDPAGPDIRRLLHDRVEGVRPDVAARAARAVLLGRRMHRRRRVAATSASLAGVAAVGVVAVQLAGSPTASSPSHMPAPLASSAATAAPDCLSAAEARKLKRKLAPFEVGPTRPGGPQPVRNWADRVRIDLCGADGATSGPEDLPVSLDAPGWTCQPPGDEKFICTSGARSALVTVRPARFHQDYLTDPDKAAPGQYVSDVHGRVFATITSPESGVADQLGSHLVWH